MHLKKTKQLHFGSQCQELYPGHVFHKNKHECVSVHASKRSKAIEHSHVPACLFLLAPPATKEGELHKRGVRKGKIRQ